MPVGSAWESSAILVSGVIDAVSTWRNILTEEIVTAENGKLALSEVFKTLPLGLLEPVFSGAIN